MLSTFKFTSATAATTSETADWKTYENTVYHFSFKYPVDSQPKTMDESGITLDKEQAIAVTGSVPFTVAGYEVGKNYQEPSKNNPVNIGSYTFYRVDTVDKQKNTTTRAYNVADDKYGIVFAFEKAKFSSADENKITNILSTFKFTN